MYIYFFIIINNRVITLLYALKSFIFVVARALLLLFCLFGLALFCLSFFYYIVGTIHRQLYIPN